MNDIALFRQTSLIYLYFYHFIYIFNHYLFKNKKKKKLFPIEGLKLYFLFCLFFAIAVLFLFTL